MLNSTLSFTFLSLFSAFGNCLKRWPISSINDLDGERTVVDWIKKYTVPNTLNGNGDPWTHSQLPKIAGKSYNTNIKPAAWAAAIVTGWAISEGDYGIIDFYRKKDSDVCPYFQNPSQLPPAGTFPLQTFTYSNCQGTAQNIDPRTNTFKDVGGDCSCCAKNNAGGRLIGPNQKCRPRDGKSDWQNGIFAMEMSHVQDDAAGIAERARKIYGRNYPKSGYTYVDVLNNTITTAGFPNGAQVYNTVMGCFPVKNGRHQYVDPRKLTWACADLVKSWLTRNHLVGLTVAMTDNVGWLAGETKVRGRFESNFNGVTVLAQYFNS
jgi:hypothetical protein